MRLLSVIILSIPLFAISCKKEVPVKKVVTAFDYLIGDWERTNEKGGSSTSEHWKVVSPSELRGHGYTIEDEDTVFNEKMRIVRRQDSWSLIISGPNEDPTVFKITARDNHSFTAVNSENEFPKIITYSYFDDVLKATIAADDIEIPFIFWRSEK